MVESLPFTADEEANRLLATEPFALLLGMLLDQQVPMEWAFGAPALLKRRLGGDLEPEGVAATPAEELEAHFRTKPALHRYPGSMAKRAHALAVFLVERYDGRAEKVWADASSGEELLQRLQELPGYGTEKARVFVALLGKRLGIRPQGWETVAADWPSIADVDSPERLREVRAQKRAMKAAKRAASEKLHG
jgi:uncharacterized HhH-GPD family protein